ncbi:hypothetical protein LC605_33080 [Nostoc sp. CHAB 5836]|uniref:hypothetical protein n=1 Tax=Nostoc sp. CHAB 5836 TaxID=2780404 RepID=UPI001E51DE6C|nr:hypothetical protein [Nostoc sp. CHAB 5836]MCC5619765.1 hypothetical protein [Nostoc sp. CHAB 5836]
MASDNSTVAAVSAGKVTGFSDGVSVLSASRNGITAVTALRVGELRSTNETEFNIELAEENGLNIYPKAIILPNGGTRQLLVGIEGIYGSPDRKNTTTGTRYFVSNSNILEIDANGLITAQKEGIANVTVIYGASEYLVPVRVEAPHTIRVSPGTVAETQLTTDGGIIEVDVLDGDNENRTMQVMVAPGTLFEDTNIRITPLLTQQLLSLSTPQGFQFLSGFKLETGNDPLMLPVQLAIELPQNLKADASLVGKTVYFFEKDTIPDINGGWKETWLVAESGVISADGMIRTQSPPWGGVRSGEYMVGIDQDINLPTGSVKLVKGKLTVTYNMPSLVTSLFPASYTVTNGLSSISIGNLNSSIAITNNYNRAYLADKNGNFVVKVFDDSLLVKYEQISVEIKDVAKEISDTVLLIQELIKQKTSLEKDIQQLERVYQSLGNTPSAPLRAALLTEAPTTEKQKEIEIQKDITRKQIIKKEEELSIVTEKIPEKTQKKESFELRRRKLDDQLGTLRGLLRAYNTAGTILGLLDTVPFLSVTYDISSLNVIQVPTVGLPQITQTGVQLNAGNLPSFEINLGIPKPQTSGPAAPPVLEQAALRFQRMF